MPKSLADIEISLATINTRSAKALDKVIAELLELTAYLRAKEVAKS